MAKRLQVFRCDVCGHIVMVFQGGGGTLVCCNQPMTFLEENTTDASKEKHVPVIEKTGSGYKVKVGAAPHPMEEKHYIAWVELLGADTLCCHFLKPGEAPEATFNTAADAVSAREYCTVHGYWKG